MAIQTVALRQSGSVELNDLIGMCPDQGDGVPYPFWRTNRSPYWGDIAKRLEPLDRRFTGQADTIGRWVSTYTQADIWVECRVNSFDKAIGDGRLMGHRLGDDGFLALQRPHADVIDIYELSAVALGAALAASAGLWRPGSRSAITVPGILDDFTTVPPPANPDFAASEDDEYGYSVTLRAQHRQSASATVDQNTLMLLGTAQSRFEPRPVRDVDWTKPAVVWVRVRNDGDYIYTENYRHAVPLTPPLLQERIDALIAADVAALRKNRGLV